MLARVKRTGQKYCVGANASPSLCNDYTARFLWQRLYSLDFTIRLLAANFRLGSDAGERDYKRELDRGALLAVVTVPLPVQWPPGRIKAVRADVEER